MWVTFFERLTDFSELQLRKTALPILVTPLPMLAEVRSPQSEKAKSPTLFTPFEMTMEVNPLLSKAELPIEVTLPGIVMDVKLSQKQKPR